LTGIFSAAVVSMVSRVIDHASSGSSGRSPEDHLLHCTSSATKRKPRPTPHCIELRPSKFDGIISMKL